MFVNILLPFCEDVHCSCLKMKRLHKCDPVRPNETFEEKIQNLDTYKRTGKETYYFSQDHKILFIKMVHNYTQDYLNAQTLNQCHYPSTYLTDTTVECTDMEQLLHQMSQLNTVSLRDYCSKMFKNQSTQWCRPNSHSTPGAQHA